MFSNFWLRRIFLLIALPWMVLVGSPSVHALEIWFGTPPYCKGKVDDCTRRGMTYLRSESPGACLLDSKKALCTIDHILPEIRRGGANELHILAWNVYLRPTTLFSNQQEQRSRIIPSLVLGYDVIVFSEAFDDDLRNRMVDALRQEYPYSTGVVGTDRGLDQDGGVIVLSRWPIEVADTRLFQQVCANSDCNAQKGIMYAKVNKNGSVYNVFATHLQADAREFPVRARQLQILREFVTSKNIPSNEAVIITGDLNVELRSTEYESMLRRLNMRQGRITGQRYTFDPRINTFASGNQEFLDHVLYSSRHLQPEYAETQVRRLLPATSWDRVAGVDREIDIDLSDHFAVYGILRFTPPLSLCQRAAQGRVAWNTRGNTDWNLDTLSSLCGSRSASAEPVRCFERLMSGNVNWGSGSTWLLENAIDLCSASNNANSTIGCFEAEISDGTNWEVAIRECRDGLF